MLDRATSEERLSAERRSSERFAIPAGAILTLSADGRRYRCIAEDISYGGLRVRFDELAPDCDEVVIRHRLSGRMAGQRTWRSGDRMGIEFRVSGQKYAHALQCVGVMVEPDALLEPQP